MGAETGLSCPVIGEYIFFVKQHHRDEHSPLGHPCLRLHICKSSDSIMFLTQGDVLP